MPQISFNEKALNYDLKCTLQHISDYDREGHMKVLFGNRSQVVFP